MNAGALGQYTIINSVLMNTFQKGIEKASPVTIDMLMKIGSSGRYNVYSWLDHIPTMRRWNRDQQRVNRNYKTIDFSVLNQRFEATISIPIDDVEDDQLGQYNAMASQMATDAALQPDRLFFEQLNYGFTGGTIDGIPVGYLYDGLPWFDTGHVVGISTIDNKITGELNETNFGIAYRRLHGYRFQADADSTSEPLNDQFKPVLIVPTVLETAAQILLENERNQYGATNVWKGKADLMVSPRLSSDTAWFLVNNGSSIKPAVLQERQKPVFIQKTPLNGDRAAYLDLLEYMSKWRGAVAPTFAWLAIGSTGVTPTT